MKRRNLKSEKNSKQKEDGAASVGDSSHCEDALFRASDGFTHTTHSSQQGKSKPWVHPTQYGFSTKVSKHNNNKPLAPRLLRSCAWLCPRHQPQAANVTGTKRTVHCESDSQSRPTVLSSSRN